MQYIENKVDTIERVEGVSRPIVQSGKTKPLQKWNAKTKSPATKSFSLSNLTVSPILGDSLIPEDEHFDVRELAHLMVDATKAFTGNISDWQFSISDNLQDLILRCAYRLRDRANIEHIEILQSEEGLRLVLKRPIGSRSTVYCIPLRPIMKLKWKHPSLYHIMLSFMKSLPYINLFHTGEDRVDWLWEYLFEEEVYHKANGSTFCNYNSVTFFDRYEKRFKDYKPQDWKTLLKNYRPRKTLHRGIKEILLETEDIDFQIPFHIGTKDAYESMFEHWESFLLVDDTNSEFTNAYIRMLNECSNEYDIISAYECTTVEKGNIKPFDDGVRYKLNQLEEFLSGLNDLLLIL